MDLGEPGTETLHDVVCWERLRKTAVGRLAVNREGQPEIYPVNYVVDGRSLVFRTRAGSKLTAPPHLERVAFEIDGFEPDRSDAWSVLVKGFGRFVEGATELQEVGELPLFPWVIADKPAFVRIVPVEITGRRFRLADGVVTDRSVGWPDEVGNADRSSAV